MTQRVVLVGAGNMGLAVGKAILAAGVSPSDVVVVNSSATSSKRAARTLGVTNGFQGVHSAAEACETHIPEADVVVVGVKPYQLEHVLPRIASRIRPDTLVLSLAAGATIDTVRGLLDGHELVVRCMPNTPVGVGEGVVALMRAPGVGREHMRTVRALLEGSATVVEIPEEHVHAQIAAAGSAPAFFFLVAEAMIDAAVAQGLRRDLATLLVVETMRGSAKVLQQMPPTEARYAVTSPAGTTARGVQALEQAGVRAAFAQAMEATAARSRELESQ